MITTTLNAIRAYHPCKDGWDNLLKHLGKTKADDEELPLLVILDSNGFDDTLWCLRAVPEHDKEWRLFAVWCARKVEHLMKDKRSIDAINVAERFANGLATQEELQDAASAAAAAAAYTAAAYTAASAAYNAAYSAAYTVAAYTVASAAAEAVAVAVAYSAAAEEDDYNAARTEQEQELRRVLS